MSTSVGILTLHAKCLARALTPLDLRRLLSTLRTFGGTPNRDPCIWGLIWGLPRDKRLYNDYIRVIYGNGIKGPY